MTYDELKSSVKEISEIAASVPEKFRDKCFELLLANLLKNESGSQADKGKDDTDKGKLDVKDDKGAKSSIPMTTQLRLLMKKTGVTTEELEKLIMYDSSDVHFIKEPHDVGIAKGQNEWALLLALKNAIVNDSLTTDPEDVRSLCQEKGFYDKANFATNFKSAKYAKLFKSALVPQGAAEPLSSEGQDELGKLIKRLASEARV